MIDDADRASEQTERELESILGKRGHRRAGVGPMNGERLCADCAAPIPPRRLEVHPEAMRCVSCQENVETSRRVG